jgi:hypothetical protein
MTSTGSQSSSCYSRWLEYELFRTYAYFFQSELILLSVQLNGLGKHIWDVSITKIPKIFRLCMNPRPCEKVYVLTGVPLRDLVYVDESLYLAIILLTKVSLLLFYLRIFPRRGFQNITRLVLVFVICSGIVILFLQIFQCLPVAYNWDKSISDGRCLNVNALTYTHAGISIFQDIVILVLPISELATLKLGRQQKLGLFFVFQVGALYATEHILS